MFKQIFSKLSTVLLTSFVVLVLASCGGSGGGDSGSSGTTYTLSGTITTNAGTVVDSDVNDPLASYSPNNSIANAQTIPNPVILGGFVSATGSGVAGSRFETTSDNDDYFAITLVAGQKINLTIAGSSDLDLYLYNAGGQVLAASLGIVTQTETVTVPNTITAPTTLYIRVRAAGLTAADNYQLSVAQAGVGSASSGFNLEDDFVPGEIIVRFRESILPMGATQDSVSIRADSIGMQARAGAPGRSMLMSMRSKTQAQMALQKLKLHQVPVAVNEKLQLRLNTLLALKALKRRADVQSASLNYIYRPHAVPNDTHYTRQWHYPLIGLPQAWDISTGSTNVIVAVIDTGVLLNHPDLAGNLVQGYDFIADVNNAGDGDGIDNNPDDPGDGGVAGSSSFHGTHVAGTVAAASNNGSGVAGVAWNVKIMPLRVLGKSGGTSYDLKQAILYAAGLQPDVAVTPPAQRADVINMSLGGLSASDTEVSGAITAARGQGVIIVASAGNDGNATAVYPASFAGVISVSAVDMNKVLAPYSSFGTNVDIAGPGGNMATDQNGDGYPDGILSTIGDDSSGSITYIYGFLQGTSMAAPHVSGVIALMKSVHGGLTPAQFDSLLASGAITEDLGNTGKDNLYGYGLIDANKAVVQAQILAGGGVVPTNPVLSVTPTSLNFGTAATSGTIAVKNNGNGTLVVSSVTQTSSGWLTVTPASVDANGVGTYAVTVDRTGLPENIYTANITVASNGGTINIPVIMQVSTSITNENAGVQYVFLLNAADGSVVSVQSVQPNSGQYSYSFTGVAAGSYNIVSGSDLDNDNNVCDAGEACGAYPILDFSNLAALNVSSDLTGLDFSTGFSSAVVNSASAGVAPKQKVISGAGIKRLAR